MMTDKEKLMRDFRQYLLASHFKDGDHLPGELELAGKFCTGRAAIREVLAFFTRLGMLTRVKNSGTVFRNIAGDKLQDEMSFCFRMSEFGYEEIRESRLLLETALAPLIVSRMNPELLQRLEENLDMQEQISQKENCGELFEQLDLQFHLLLLEACHNRSLSLFSNVLACAFSGEHRKKFMAPEVCRLSCNRHKRILSAVRKGDAALLAKLIRSHILTT